MEERRRLVGRLELRVQLFPASVERLGQRAVTPLYIDPRDRHFITDEPRTPEGFHRVRGGIEFAIAGARAYAPYADMLWRETSRPSLHETEAFQREVGTCYFDERAAAIAPCRLDPGPHRIDGG